MFYHLFKKEYLEFINQSLLSTIKIKTKRSFIDKLCMELQKSPDNICIGYEKCLDIDYIVFIKN